MKFVPAKCPSCNGEIQVPEEKDYILCMYCGTSIKVREVLNVIQHISPNIQILEMEANKAFKDNKYKDAEDLCDKILIFEPNNTSIILLRAKSSFMYRMYEYFVEELLLKRIHLYPALNKSSEGEIKLYFNKAIDNSINKDSISKEINDFMFDKFEILYNHIFSELKPYSDRLINLKSSDIYAVGDFDRRFSMKFVPFMRLLVLYYEFLIEINFDKRFTNKIVTICNFILTGLDYEVQIAKIFKTYKEKRTMNIYNCSGNNTEYINFFESKLKIYNTQL